jgi:hypothetical protein
MSTRPAGKLTQRAQGEHCRQAVEWRRARGGGWRIDSGFAVPAAALTTRA